MTQYKSEAETKEQDKEQKIELQIEGMTCASCEVLIERKLKKIEGIDKVEVNHASGKAVIHYAQRPSDEALHTAIKSLGYKIKEHDILTPVATKKKYYEIGGLLIAILGVYLLVSKLDLASKFGITDNMSYGFIFVLGLVAAMSTCLAITGGLLLTLTAKYTELHPELTGYQKFKPQIYFNIGRIIGYTVLGGLIGAVGSLFTFSSKATGIITIVASIIMIFLGLQLLDVLPFLKRFQPKMPKFLAHKLYDATHHPKKQVPFLLGAGTFFLPCGFTQALQLYVLSKGDFVTGALTMLAFSLGTFPALISLGYISSYAKGNFQKYFFKTVGIVVVIIGLFTINNGFNLAGANIINDNNGSDDNNLVPSQDPNVKIQNNMQVVDMKVIGYEYYPSQFTVVEGIPVQWNIDASQAAGCAQVISIPKLNRVEYLPKIGSKTITFTPKESGTIEFMCTMGMTTKGARFNVISNTNKIKPNNVETEADLTANNNEDNSICNPEIMDCNVQKLSMEISREKGFYPNQFYIKKDIPVELEIDTKLQLNGCMGTMVIPDYNVAHKLSLGKTTLKFTPTEKGTSVFTCSMGSKLGEFIVS